MLFAVQIVASLLFCARNGSPENRTCIISLMCPSVNRPDRLCYLDESPGSPTLHAKKGGGNASLVNRCRLPQTLSIWVALGRGRGKEWLFADAKTAENARHDILIPNFPYKLPDKGDYFADFFHIDLF